MFLGNVDAAGMQTHLKNHCSRYPQSKGEYYYSCDKEPRENFEQVTNVTYNNNLIHIWKIALSEKRRPVKRMLQWSRKVKGRGIFKEPDV